VAEAATSLAVRASIFFCSTTGRGPVPPQVVLAIALQFDAGYCSAAS